jgi:hypothetical protein
MVLEWYYRVMPRSGSGERVCRVEELKQVGCAKVEGRRDGRSGVKGKELARGAADFYEAAAWGGESLEPEQRLECTNYSSQSGKARLGLELMQQLASASNQGSSLLQGPTSGLGRMHVQPQILGRLRKSSNSVGSVRLPPNYLGKFRGSGCNERESFSGSNVDCGPRCDVSVLLAVI